MHAASAGRPATPMVASSLQEKQTWDEGIHMVAGYGYLKTGDFTVNREHPPLSKLLFTLLLLVLDPAYSFDDPRWRKGDAVYDGKVFLYRNRTDEMLRARAPTCVAAVSVTQLQGELGGRRNCVGCANGSRWQRSATKSTYTI
jgi:hypothetical protein